MQMASRTWSASTWRSDDDSKDGDGRLGGHHASRRHDPRICLLGPPCLVTSRVGELALTLDRQPRPHPADPSNTVADDPRAAALGQALFLDTRFSANGQVSCGTCHKPDREFTDGLPLAHGVGTTHRTIMPLPGTQYTEFLFWDGRKDSQWAQALGPLESAVEHGGSRGQYAHIVAGFYKDDYENLFGP